MLDHIPLRIRKQVLQIVGETPEPGEPHIHELRRLRLQMAEKASAETKTDTDNPKVNVDWVRPIFEFG